MQKKFILVILVGFVFLSAFSAFSIIRIAANKDLPVITDMYDKDGALKFSATEEDKRKKEKALKELAEAVKKQEDGTMDKGGANTAEVTHQQEPLEWEKLNLGELGNYDNTKYSWWIKLNNGHRSPTIPEYAEKMITECNGVYLGDISRKKIYITFDEGYENGYTSRILDVLKGNNVKSIFFVTGPYIKENTSLVKRMLDEGHLVGNHTIHHPSLPSVSLDKLENELFGLEKQFKALFGTGFKYMRPPKGEYSKRVLEVSRQLGYKTVFWSFAYEDYDIDGQKGADYAYKKVMDNLHNGAIILLHAVSKDNADALDRIIKDVKAQGYEISPFDL